MEKKTMGSFLAALRRASGMTQKELAERLNVSDKSVSRWERDDGAPDLALIPVIAEVFGVTCDELLRGERAAAGEEQGAQSTPKGEQQKKHLLAASLSRFRSRCCIALALAAAGFLVAMACNSALDRALLGFFLGAVFFVAAAAVETVQLNAALLAIHDEEGEAVDAFRRAVVRGAEQDLRRRMGALCLHAAAAAGVPSDHGERLYPQPHGRRDLARRFGRQRSCCLPLLSQAYLLCGSSSGGWWKRDFSRRRRNRRRSVKTTGSCAPQRSRSARRWR